ncbi:SH3 domain-containing protein [Phyllobacterium sp. 21LDTY02-6]|uniref:SH3 domain-containing protein n=1 Tax=Phyllobacterium sp. 21LDTY02-6 TaxID=2944903 RepID=UPI003531A9A0
MLTAKILRPFLLAAAIATALLPASAIGVPGATSAMAAGQVGPSGLPLPRFVSLKPGRVNLRVGPGRDYAVTWLFLKSGLPVEIIQEYDNWRRIRDSEGTEGWVYQSLLSGKRTALTAPWQRDKDGFMLNVYRNADDKAPVVAKVQPGVLGTLKTCDGDFCRVVFSGTSGWMRQTDIWGAYPGEKFED